MDFAGWAAWLGVSRGWPVGGGVAPWGASLSPSDSAGRPRPRAGCFGRLGASAGWVPQRAGRLPRSVVSARWAPPQVGCPASSPHPKAGRLGKLAAPRAVRPSGRPLSSGRPPSLVAPQGRPPSQPSPRAAGPPGPAGSGSGPCVVGPYLLLGRFTGGSPSRNRRKGHAGRSRPQPAARVSAVPAVRPRPGSRGRADRGRAHPYPCPPVPVLTRGRALPGSCHVPLSPEAAPCRPVRRSSWRVAAVS